MDVQPSIDEKDVDRGAASGTGRAGLYAVGGARAGRRRKMKAGASPGSGASGARPSNASAGARCVASGGSIGWWLGARIGFMTAFMVSTVFTGVGVYAAIRISSHYGF